jgi:hypothetical protein
MNSLGLNSPRQNIGITPLAPMVVPKAVTGYQFMCAVEIRRIFDLEEPTIVQLTASDGSKQDGYVCAGCMRTFPNLAQVFTDMPTYEKPEPGESEKPKTESE